MSGTGERMNKLRQLLAVRCGPGAAILPPQVTRLHLSYSYGMSGHMGPRKFVRAQLPRLKFWNPAIPMVINRGPNTKNSAVMTIYLTSEDAPVTTFTGKKKQESIYPVYSIPIDPSQRLKASSYEKNSPAPVPAPNEKIVRIGMYGKTSDAILDQFLDITKAQAVSATPGEQQEMENFVELNRVAVRDREVNRIRLEKERKQADVMKRLAAKVADSAASSGL